MTVLLTSLALILALAGVFLSPKSEDQPSWISLATAALVGAILVGLAKALPLDDSTTNAWIGIGWGAGAALAVGLIGRWKDAATVVPLGMAAATAINLHQYGPSGMFGYVLGAAAIALTLGSNSVGFFALAGMAGVAATYFGAVGAEPSQNGLKVGSVLAVAAFASLFLKKWPMAVIAVATVSSAVALFLIQAPTGLASSISLLVPPIAGLSVSLLLAADEKSKMSTSLVASLIWVGVATVAFAATKSSGMSLALLAAAGVPIILGNAKSAGSAAPLVALVCYRLVRQSDPDLARGSDLTTFYLLIGVLAGATISALAWEYRSRVTGTKGTIGGGIWAVLAAGAAVLIQVVFGIRGLSGLLVGSGIGSVTPGGDGSPMTPVAVSGVVGATAAILIKWTDQVAPQSQNEKLRLFLYWGMGILVVAGVLVALQRTSKTLTDPEPRTTS